MLKNILISIACIVVILAAGGFYVYSQRDVIAENIAEYATQNKPITPPTPVTENNTQNEEKQWNNAAKQSSAKKAKNNPVTPTQSGKKSKNKGEKSNYASAVKTLAGSAPQSNLGNAAQKVSTFLGFGPLKTKANKENSNYNAQGQTLLMNLCKTGVDVKSLDMVVKYGADINAKDNNGRTALMYAVAFNPNPEVVKYLLAHGADAKITDLQGKTALDYASDNEIIQLLKRSMYKN
ncbi:MAG: ankyrin repeat domain-containing protein [Alphaproteobacteria bacterium]|nr:ankyrin repeat domain-containing protein [Alphaproteobacteria bacterium]